MGRVCGVLVAHCSIRIAGTAAVLVEEKGLERNSCQQRKSLKVHLVTTVNHTCRGKLDKESLQ
jgi:6-phosphofructokinase